MLITLAASVVVGLISIFVANFFRNIKLSSGSILLASVFFLLLACVSFFLSAYIIYCTFFVTVTEQTIRLNPSISYDRKFVYYDDKKVVVHVSEIRLSDVNMQLTNPSYDGNKYFLEAKKTSVALRENDADLAVNASFFFPFREKHLFDYYPHSGDKVYPVGLTINEGVVHGSGGENWPSFIVYKSGAVEIKQLSYADAQSNQLIQYAFSGRQFLVKSGSLAVKEMTESYPRTVIGINQKKTHYGCL